MPDPKTMNQAVPVVTVGNEGNALRFEARLSHNKLM